MMEMPTDCSCDVTVVQLYVNEEPSVAGKMSFLSRCGPAGPRVELLLIFFQNQLLPSVCFCLYVNITSQCRILNKRDLCDKLFFCFVFVLFLFFGGGGVF